MSLFSKKVHEAIFGRDDDTRLKEYLNKPNFFNFNEITNEDYYELLQASVDCRAWKCLQFLKNTQLKNQFLPDQQITLIKRAAKNCDIATILILCENNEKLAAQHLFNDYCVTSEMLTNRFFIMLRFTAFATVDRLFNEYYNSQSEKKLKTLLTNSYEQAKKSFSEIGPYFSRYTKQIELIQLDDLYRHSKDFKIDLDLQQFTALDVKCGEERKQIAKDLVGILKKNGKFNTTNTQYDPHSVALLALPGKKRLAGVLCQIQNWFFDRCLRFGGGFGNVRDITKTSVCCTDVEARYRFGSSLVNAFIKYSNAEDYSVSRLVVHTKDGSIPKATNYHFKYGNEPKQFSIAKIRVNVDSSEGFGRWFHGLAPLTDSWGDMEELFDSILAMDLKKKGKEYDEERLTEFYQKAATLVWLIGNSQPFMRGSGSIAEITLAVIHLYHGLQPPTLRVEFP